MNKPSAVKDIMSPSLLVFTPEMDLLDASQLLVYYGVSGAPVVDEHGQLAGILTERDCFKSTLTAGYHGELAGKVAEYMSRVVESVEPDTGILDLAERFLTSKYRRYPVVKDGSLVGIVSRRDVLEALLRLSRHR